MQQARERDLLLIAAGERAHGLQRRARLDRSVSIQRAASRALRRESSQPRRSARVETRARDVVGERQRQREPFALAVFAQVAGALLDARPRLRGAATLDARDRTLRRPPTATADRSRSARAPSARAPTPCVPSRRGRRCRGFRLPAASAIACRTTGGATRSFTSSSGAPGAARSCSGKSASIGGRPCAR